MRMRRPLCMLLPRGGRGRTDRPYYTCASQAMPGRFIPLPSSHLDQAHVAAALTAALWTLMAAVLLMLGAIVMLPERTGRWLTIIAGVYAFAVPALIANRRGHTRLASVIALAS